MKFKQLKEIATDLKQDTTSYIDDGIIMVSFHYKGGNFEAQYSCDNEGLYAFSLTNPEEFFGFKKAEEGPIV